MNRIVADLGNSRLKWGRVTPDGRLAEVVSLPTDDPAAWLEAWNGWGLDGDASWSIASVNPPLAAHLADFLAGRGVAEPRWFRSARDVAIRHEIEHAETAGADRALAVAGAMTLAPAGCPGLVVSCGTAVTVERVAADGTWQGGAIAPGLGPMARALRVMTAQLPEVAPVEAPEPWGRSTRPALEAGVFWGVVGAIRELVARQSAGLADPWLFWTGGDAPRFASYIVRDGSRVVPHLVLEGLIRQAPYPIP
ncbi:type III pantothenate kinase [Tundrisphaera sp. TA3]|uniref:type III pantothenate kinase n=1 Tax=Tundrisphaera sp. TA3 TaxID=3435775 RepID=UPI003EB98B75